MDRGIHKVRQSIKQRKKQREVTEKQVKRTLPLVATDEEKHGFEQPVYHLEPTFTKGKQTTFSRNRILAKVILAIGLFIFTSFTIQSKSTSLERVQDFMYGALQDEFPFARVNEWYVTNFGFPQTFTPQGNIQLGNEHPSGQLSLPVMGHVVETFSMTGTGILISPQANTNVASLNRGVVIFAGNDAATGKTVVVQHADGSETTYGLLSSIDVHLYQIVEVNQPIGTFQPTAENELVYFSIEKDNEFIDPSQVIPVDDIP